LTEDLFVATYSYRCTACGHRFDAVQRMADDPLSECPSCGGLVRRTIQSVPVVFKGSGWYVTDSRNRKSDGDSSEKSTKDAASSSGEKPSEKAKSAASEPVTSAAD
jgi:putative FmdB family regulatory protein